MSKIITNVFVAKVAFQSFYRTAILRLLGLRVAQGSQIGKGIRWPIVGISRIQLGCNVHIGDRTGFWIQPFNNTGKIVIGENVNIGDECRISAGNLVKIGKNTIVLHRVTIVDFGRIFNQYSDYGRFITAPKPVIIGCDCSIGANTVIKPGTELGDLCVVGPNAVVGGKHPAGSILEGNPAKVVGQMPH